MIQQINRVVAILAILLVCLGGIAFAQNARERKISDWCSSGGGLSGLYRIDVESSDQLYSIIEEATSRVPYGEQQQFFIDLAVRLTPPDLLAIECRGKNVSLGSSRAARVNFLADGVLRSARNSDGRTIRSRIAFEGDSLSFISTGGDDNLSFTFTPLDNGDRLRVIRRISSRELIEPIVIQTFYRKIAEVARWDIFDESLVARQDEPVKAGQNSPQTVLPGKRRESKTENSDADNLRRALEQWIEATNRRDIGRQMSFYMPQMKAFYLARNVSQNSVRAEKNRVFASAKSIDIQAAEPEIIFQDSARTAVMRFRKKYDVSNGRASRRGEVIQELRWQRTNDGWKIFSERDIKVIR